jgi:sarcosine oxidase / L-pipecolate oxidase
MPVEIVLTFAYSYQNLAIEARDMWLDWNKQIKNSRPDQLPGGLTPDDELLLITGSCFLSEGERLHEYYETSLSTMERTAPEFRQMQFVKVCKSWINQKIGIDEESPPLQDNFEDESRLGEIGDRWLVKLHALDKINHGNVNGFMDIQAGIMLADKVHKHGPH